MADFVFSSSPAEVVYLIPDQTIAPIAKRAPNWSTLVATFTTSSLTPSCHPLGGTTTARFPSAESCAQPERKSLADPHETGSHAAKVGTNTVRENKDEKEKSKHSFKVRYGKQ